MPKLVFLAATAALAATPQSSQPRTELLRRIDQLDRATVRLSPTAFAELPKNLVRELQRRGCTIPQHGLVKERHNVIRGEFQRPGQTDWAVLCSVQRVSSILVFFNGAEANPAELARMPDREQLFDVYPPEDGRPGRIGPKSWFTRSIRSVGREVITRWGEEAPVKPPPVIDHQGIDDAHLDCCSQIHYWYSGKWLRLQGGD